MTYLTCPAIPALIAILSVTCFMKLDHPVTGDAATYLVGYYLMLTGLFLLSVVSVLLMPIRVTKSRMVTIRHAGIFHLTVPANFDSIMSGDQADIWKSKSVFWNVGNLCIGKCAFFFENRPGPIARFINLCGRHRPGEFVTIHLCGEDLPDRIYTRLIDRAVLIPGGHKGRARWIG